MSEGLRNVAIIAHVDHGKTTLVDKMIAQAGLIRAHQQVQECMLDSNDLERERGITILAKNISLRYCATKINIFDTPGHADFGGEVERVLRMADGVLLLVDAFEGPMPQTRFVLRKSLECGHMPIVVVNKMDRADARPDTVVDLVFDLMVDLGADDRQLDFPVLYASGRDGWARTEPEPGPGDMTALFDAILRRIPAPTDPADAPLQLQVSALDWSEFTGRMAIGRVTQGVLVKGSKVAVVKEGDEVVIEQGRKIMVFEGMGKEEVDEVRAGDVCAIEGLENVNIGDTICDPEHVDPLSRLTVDEPTISMMFTVNDGPFAGLDGRYVTSRQVRGRLHREQLKNVALRVEDTDRPETLKVSGRGVLHLGILVEEMRREGYEFCVGKPRVIMREVDGKRHEPIELVTVEVPEKHAGKVIELLGQRRGELVKMEPQDGVTRLEFSCPARGLIGIRTRILNLTQGEAVLHHVFQSYEPHKGEVAERGVGVMVSGSEGEAVTYALEKLKDRGVFFIPPQTKVYEGMVVGEHSKSNDLPVNVTKGKKHTNIRTQSADRKLFLPPHRDLGVEEALEYIAEDELVEMTPKNIRLRKASLRESDRRRLRRVEKG
ncbi:MAG: translational GTPase TypA [Planctomycetes bacterium]|nr:translational GTPase TypA [Planctomycetota bacterium]